MTDDNSQRLQLAAILGHKEREDGRGLAANGFAATSPLWRAWRHGWRLADDRCSRLSAKFAGWSKA